MMSDERKPLISEANKALQESLDRSEPVIFASYGLIGAVLLLGGAGYVLDRWLGTLPWFLAAGLLVGVVGGFFGLIRTTSKG
jgi:F0F1-type ATP synthase assembly protein I